MPKPLTFETQETSLEKQTDFEIIGQPSQAQEKVTEQKSIDQEGIETSSISKQSSLQYFVKKIKEGETPTPKDVTLPEPIKQEIYQKFEPSMMDTTKEIEIPITLEDKIPPHVPPKPESSKKHEFFHQPALQEQKSFSTIQQVVQPQKYQTFSSTQQMTQEIELKPEEPAEICYAPKLEGYKKREEVSERIKRISESQKDLSAHEVPPGAVKIFPTTPKPSSQQFGELKEFSHKTEQSFQQSSYQTSSSSYSHSFGSSINPPFEALPKESIFPLKLEPERPISAASSHSVTDRQIYRPVSAQIAPGEPSPEGLLMEKKWAHKFSESHVEKSWPPPQYEEPSWSVQSTLEKKWTPSEIKTMEVTRERKVTVDEIPKQHYIAEVSNLGSIVEQRVATESSYDSQVHMSKSENIVEERNVRPSQVIRTWPPDPVEPLTKYVPTIDSLIVRPVSVQDITDEVYLEPGPPPEIAYAQPPRERRQSYVETIEHELEKNLEPAKVPPCAVRTIPPPREWIVPPPLPPKQVLPQAPPLPAKSTKPVEPSRKMQQSQSVPFEKFPELEPFPFKAEPHQTKPHKLGPPPTPSKFIKGKFTDSDYESDFESIKIPPKWKPCMSDTEEPTYRKVKPPKLVHFGKSRSQEHEPLPPSKFDHPPQFEGPSRPTINFEGCREVKKFTKHVRDMKRPVSPPTSIHVQPVKKPYSPKLEQKLVADGYMADTDEPFRQQKLMTTEYCKEEKSEYRQFSESKKEYVETQKFSTGKPRVSKFPIKKQHTPSVTSKKKELIATPIITSHTSEQIFEQHEQQTKLEPFPFKPELSKPHTLKCPPPPSPSKFVKGEFRESDYESDYEGRISAMWHSDTECSYKPVRPVLTPAQQHRQFGRTPTPPTEFDRPRQVEGPSRPKFEPIEKIKSEVKPLPKSVVYKPKPISAAPVTRDVVPARTIILQPGTPPEIAYAAGPKKTQYYRSTVSAPYTNAIQTETSNVVHFNESTESCHRTMSVQQTHKVIKFGDQKQETKLEPFPFKAEPEKPRRSTSVPPPPTPTKFQPGEFRESDYESEVECTRIKPKWVPGGVGADSFQYRRVRAPAAARSTSVPAPRDRILSPMEYDTQPPLMPMQTSTTDIVDGERKHESLYKRFTDNQVNQLVRRSHSHEPVLHPGTPPEYGYASDQRISKSTATKIASHHMDSMTQAFKSKTQQFVTDIMEDVNKKKAAPKPILKNGSDGDAQVYREESRAAQYGTKHVDPDTGLIYFKYDFGYEFGIILPGESKQGGEIPVPKKTVIEPPKRTADIEMPVYHEKSTSNTNLTPQFKPKKFTPSSKTAKWEPTSESEMSEYEGEARRTNHISQGSGRKGAETPPSCPSTPGSTHGKSNLQQGQIRAPLFITPLRDIAVTSGQAAKFECIVQSEPQPNILWSKNGRIIENSQDHHLHYRNGVCRLTISQAYPEDAGTYSCTAANPAGTANTTATLLVPGVPSHMYGTYRQLNTVRRNHSPELYRRPESPENLPLPAGKFNGLRFRLENYN
ncbi:hypothetical protein JTB14_030238 [Gonioctena quinquepunctata]|nr:hypothetical protein JTB14_030238 [Gonioctena quinquepunctata]